MEDVSSPAKGAGQGDSGALGDAAIILAESGTARDANTGGADEEAACAASLPTTSCSEFHSARIARMLSSRSEFETESEYWTAHSKVHWSELSSQERACSSEESGSGSGEAVTGGGDQSGVDHRQYFEKLQKDAVWGRFCSGVTDVMLVKKLGEGAQGVVYEAQVTFDTVKKSGMRGGYVVKVMKSGYALEDLHRQWPRGLATLKDSFLERYMFPLYGTLVKDHATERNRFGFVMPKRWGDLRRLIDLRMERNNGKGPPFSTEQARTMIHKIAIGMYILHRSGIIHRDLKAANVLLSHLDYGENIDLVTCKDPDFCLPHVADWECSVGVVGTGFWRAPEILRQLKDGTPSFKLVFTKEMDVYSFAMTCYEIVTGKLPFEDFEDLPFSEMRDAILDGARPELPQDMCPIMKHVIKTCWHSKLIFRPNFGDLESWFASKKVGYFFPSIL